MTSTMPGALCPRCGPSTTVMISGFGVWSVSTAQRTTIGGWPWRIVTTAVFPVITTRAPRSSSAGSGFPLDSPDTTRQVVLGAAVPKTPATPATPTTPTTAPGCATGAPGADAAGAGLTGPR